MSGVCALSPGVGFLIGARMLQGLGAAIMLPASLSLLSHAFPHPEERARAVAFWASIVSLGFAAGPALGGVLTNYLGWRSIFWLNVPVGLAALVMVRRFVDETRVPHPRQIDWAGQAAVTLSLFTLTYGLIEAGSAGWTAPRVLGAFAASALLAAGFFPVERSSASPVLPRGLFLNRSFSVFVTTGLVLNFGMYGTLFIESIYLQNTRHLSALASGLMILPVYHAADDHHPPSSWTTAGASTFGGAWPSASFSRPWARRRWPWPFGVPATGHSRRPGAHGRWHGLHHARDDRGRAQFCHARHFRPGFRGAQLRPAGRRHDRRGADGAR
ncbi:MAG: MFS transporter [Chthoniobacter sp.]